MKEQSRSELVGLARLFWMMIGPAVMLLLVMSIAQHRGGWLTPYDFAYLIVLALVPAARWYEFHAGSPFTSTGEPATPQQLRNYCVGALLVGLGAWVAANLIGSGLPAA